MRRMAESHRKRTLQWAMKRMIPRIASLEIEAVEVSKMALSFETLHQGL